MDKPVGITFVETIEEVSRADEIPTVPGPVETRDALPFQVAIIRRKWVGGITIQFLLRQTRKDRLLEGIHPGRVGHRGEGSIFGRVDILQPQVDTIRLGISAINKRQ